jgi:hypothetical protein
MWLVDKHNRLIHEQAAEFYPEGKSNRIFPNVAGPYLPDYSASHPKIP